MANADINSFSIWPVACQVVASPVGVNCEIVDHGVNGFLAADRDEWQEALAVLRDDPALRNRMGNSARKKIEQQYCLQPHRPRMLTLLESAVAKREVVVERDHNTAAD